MGGILQAIAAGPRPVEVPSVQDLQARNMQLQAMAQAGQLRQMQMAESQQNMQMNALKMQEAQADWADQQKWRQAYSDAGGDLDKAFGLAAERGVGYRVLGPIKEQALKQAQERANLDKTTYEKIQTVNDLMHGALTPVLNEKDPVKQEQLWNSAWREFRQRGWANDQDLVQHQYPGPQGVQQYADHLNTDKWITARAAEMRGQAQQTQAGIAQQKWSAEQIADASKDLSVRLGAAKDQDEYNQVLLDAGATLPYSIVKKFEGRTPEEAQLLGMTPAEQAKAMKETPEKLPTEYSLAYQRTNPNDPPEKRAADAMRFVDQSRLATRPVQGVTVMVPNQEGGYTATKVAPGQSVGPGAVTPAGMSSMNVPTANTRGMAEKAPRVIEFVDRMLQLLDENEKQLGPLSGRWSEFTAGKIGLPNRGYTQLRTNRDLLQTALMNMHVGARGGEGIMEHFKSMIDTSMQDPVNLRAALGEIRDYAERVRQEGGPKGVVPPPPPSARKDAPPVGTIKNGYMFGGGDPAKPENWKKMGQ